MAENEILDMGHWRHWASTRRALRAENCSEDDVLAAAKADLEGVCRSLQVALRKGKPLSILLGSALSSSLQAQAVIALFQEKRLATVVRDSIKLAGCSDCAIIASIAAKKLIEGLIGQFGIRVGRCEAFRSLAARQKLVADVAQSFAPYEDALRQSIEASLRGDRIRAFRSLMPRAPRMPPSQVITLSVTQREQPRAP